MEVSLYDPSFTRFLEKNIYHNLFVLGVNAKQYPTVSELFDYTQRWSTGQWIL